MTTQQKIEHGLSAFAERFWFVALVPCLILFGLVRLFYSAMYSQSPFAKRAVAGILTIAMVFAIFPLVDSQESEATHNSVLNLSTSVLRGDVNGDGIVDYNDVITLREIVSGHSLIENNLIADFNGDGVIDEEDVKILLEHIQGVNPFNTPRIVDFNEYIIQLSKINQSIPTDEFFSKIIIDKKSHSVNVDGNYDTLYNGIKEINSEIQLCSSDIANLIGVVCYKSGIKLSLDELEVEFAIEVFETDDEIIITRDFQSSRLVVKTQSPEILLNTAPINHVFNDDGINILQFDSPEKAQFEYERISSLNFVEWVSPDRLIKQNIPEISETTSNYSNTNSRTSPSSFHTHRSWGAQAIGANTFAMTLRNSDNQNIDRIIVAVVDTGVDVTHPFLSGRTVQGINFQAFDTDTNNPHDTDGHGTHVAGTIIDVTPNLPVYIMPVKVSSDRGYDGYWETFVGAGIRWATDNGANVINFSMGSLNFCDTHRERLKSNSSDEEKWRFNKCNEIMCEAIIYASARGSTVVIAAGNGCQFDDCSVPLDTSQSGCPEHLMNHAIVVAASNQEGLPAREFSNFGESVIIAAPELELTVAFLLAVKWILMVQALF
jgi:hypothetical protein